MILEVIFTVLLPAVLILMIVYVYFSVRRIEAGQRRIEEYIRSLGPSGDERPH